MSSDASPPRAGYTLPVFACASAIAALHYCQNQVALSQVSVNLVQPAEMANIAIEQVAQIQPNLALAITRSDPGDNLDLTRHTPIWALVEVYPNSEGQEKLVIQGGEGIGKILDLEGKAAIYAYAYTLLRANLEPRLNSNECAKVTLILPEGRQLAQRTSNEAFGVVEGLSLLGTTGISQPLSAPGQLTEFREQLKSKIAQLPASSPLVFCIGENGLDLAQQLGISPERLVKTANWLGPMLVEAGVQKLPALLLFGYHGKLIKLAGGIFHTHHHLADGRLDILTAHCANLGLPTPHLQQIFACPTVEAGLQYLRSLDLGEGTPVGGWVKAVYSAIAHRIDQQCQDYIEKHAQQKVKVGSVLFDRDRQIIITSQNGSALWQTNMLH